MWSRNGRHDVPRRGMAGRSTAFDIIARPMPQSHGAADPGRPVNVHVRVDGWPGQLFALLFRDWLKANLDVQSEYVAVKCKAQEARDYPEAKEAWFDDAYVRAWEWADSTGWRP